MATEFDARLEIRAPVRLAELIDAAAAKQLMDRSSYIRSALVDRLRADGVGGGTWGQTLWAGDVYLTPSKNEG
jgi:uncharacterized protein with beta-barrel porin domain